MCSVSLTAQFLLSPRGAHTDHVTPDCEQAPDINHSLRLCVYASTIDPSRPVNVLRCRDGVNQSWTGSELLKSSERHATVCSWKVWRAESFIPVALSASLGLHLTLAHVFVSQTKTYILTYPQWNCFGFMCPCSEVSVSEISAFPSSG